MKYVEGKQTRAERKPVSSSGAKLGDVLKSKLGELAGKGDKED